MLVRRSHSGPWAGATLRVEKLGFSQSYAVPLCRGPPTCAHGSGAKPVFLYSPRQLERSEEYFKPHESIDLVEEKPLPPLGRHNSSAWEARFSHPT